MNHTSPLKRWIAAAALLAATSSAIFAQEEAPPGFDSGTTSFMFISSVLVLLMTLPGLALFYGGLVRSKTPFPSSSSASRWPV